MKRDHRYRLCARCGKQTNVSKIGQNPKRYICHTCESRDREKRRAAYQYAGAAR